MKDLRREAKLKESSDLSIKAECSTILLHAAGSLIFSRVTVPHLNSHNIVRLVFLITVLVEETLLQGSPSDGRPMEHTRACSMGGVTVASYELFFA